MSNLLPIPSTIESRFKYLLYVRLKNTIGYHRSQQFKDWFHNKYPDKDPHHPFGSHGKLKTSDYTCIPLTRIQHSAIDKEFEFAIDNLDFMLQTMIKYIKFLEEQCQLIPH